MQSANRSNNLETIPPPRRLNSVLAPEWSGFPAALTSLFGREQEVAQVSELLRNPNQRLVTLLGPGGVGKTRLAIAVAENVEDHFADGSAFVALAPVSHPDGVPAAMAATLGVVSHPDRSTTQSIILMLRERHFLLILDNLEHVLSGAVTDCLLELLDCCPHLCVLVTSREPLRVNREQRFVTPSLFTPATECFTEAFTDLPAVQLFVARASAVRQDFTLTAGESGTVVEICRRLDGLPLAIELVAAWMRVLTPAGLLARLTQCLPLLSGGNADQPARFQTMRAAIRWSYDLLTPEEAAVLRRLSVFRGGFTLEAAARIALPAAEHQMTPELTVLNLITTLCDKSLLAPVAMVGAVQRFSMLETVREFAYEQLAATDEFARIENAHAAYFRDWLESLEPEIFGPLEQHLFELIAAEAGNVQLAVSWGIRDDADLAQRTGASLWAYYGLSNPAEGLRWLKHALAAPGHTSAYVRSRALRTAGALAVLIGNYDEAIVLAAEALDLALHAGAPWLEGEARWILAACDLFAGNLAHAEQHLALAIEKLDPARTPIEITTNAYVRSALGAVAFLHGNRAWGIELYDRAVADLRIAGGAGVSMIVMTDYAGWLIALERLPQARQLLYEALCRARHTPTSWPIAGILIGLALADALEGHAIAAAYKLGAVEGIRSSRGVTVPLQFQQRIEQATVVARGALEQFAFAEAFDQGRLNANDIVNHLLADPLEPGLDDVQQQAARRLGLTRREHDVLPYLVAGLSDREIASHLFISHRTASSHVGKIMQRLGASSRADAAVRAVRLRLV